MSSKICFCTHVSDDWYIPGGAKNLEKSFKYFHPDIDFITFKSKEISEEFNRGKNWYTMNPAVTRRISSNYDLVVHMDADSLVVGKLDEILSGDFTIAGVRNNNDNGTAGGSGKAELIRKKNGEQLSNDPFSYWNAGLIASTDPEFWNEWDARNSEANDYVQYEQDILNIMVCEKTNTKLLDSINTDLYYGLSSAYGRTNSWHWDSWREIEVDNGLKLNNKRIKVLHQAGGQQIFPKMVPEVFFNLEVQSFIKEIVK